MGISYDAIVLVGFKVDEEDCVGAVQKFNEDTGKPYMTTVKTGTSLVCQGKTLTLNWEEYSEEFEGLEVVESGYENGQKFLGKIVAKVSEYYDEWEELDPCDQPDEVVDFANQHGLQINSYLIQRCG